MVAALHVPTGDALTSGGTYAIAGVVERMVQHVRNHCGAEPKCIMTGGAGWKTERPLLEACRISA